MRYSSRIGLARLALGVLLATVPGCAKDAMAAPTDANLSGTWVDDGDPFFASITLVLTATTNGYRGEAVGKLRVCTDATVGTSQVCDLTGTLIELVQNGADVGFTLSWREGAVGGPEFIGTLGADGLLSGKFVARKNGKASGPFAMQLHR